MKVIRETEWTAAEMGHKGGKRRAQRLSPERRREIAAMGWKARQARHTPEELHRQQVKAGRAKGKKK